MLRAKSEERLAGAVLVGAHYDHLGYGGRGFADASEPGPTRSRYLRCPVCGQRLYAYLTAPRMPFPGPASGIPPPRQGKAA